jgi:HPt (histidine-containing phosphotransfer) domain-containing protein
LTWVAQWPEHNLAENSVNVDATVLAAAASEAEQLWQVNPNELDRTTTRHVLGS